MLSAWRQKQAEGGGKEDGKSGKFAACLPVAL